MIVTTLKDGQKMLSSCRDKQDLEKINETLKSIDIICDSAFYGNKYLTEIVIPDNVNYIGESAFANCNNLTKVTLP